MTNADPQTLTWWNSLKAVSVLNVVLWCLTAALVPADQAFRLPHLVLSAVFVGVCGFRSFFPRVDLERTVMVDHSLSGIVLGRSCATVAEMCFTVQVSLILIVLGESTGVASLTPIGQGIVPLIAVAQITCWLGKARR